MGFGQSWKAANCGSSCLRREIMQNRAPFGSPRNWKRRKLSAEQARPPEQVAAEFQLGAQSIGEISRRKRSMRKRQRDGLDRYLVALACRRVAAAGDILRRPPRPVCMRCNQMPSKEMLIESCRFAARRLFRTATSFCAPFVLLIRHSPPPYSVQTNRTTSRCATFCCLPFLAQLMLPQALDLCWSVW